MSVDGRSVVVQKEELASQTAVDGFNEQVMAPVACDSFQDVDGRLGLLPRHLIKAPVVDVARNHFFERLWMRLAIPTTSLGVAGEEESAVIVVFEPL